MDDRGGFSAEVLYPRLKLEVKFVHVRPSLPRFHSRLPTVLEDAFIRNCGNTVKNLKRVVLVR